MKQFLLIVHECSLEEIADLARFARARDERFWTELPQLRKIGLHRRMLKFWDCWVNDTFRDVDWLVYGEGTSTE